MWYVCVSDLSRGSSVAAAKEADLLYALMRGILSIVLALTTYLIFLTIALEYKKGL